MLILNTLTIILQFIIVGLVSILSMNIVRQFSGSARKMAILAPAIFVNHGGGPLPLLGDKDHVPLTKFLKDDIHKFIDLKDVRAIILVTAHWEEPKVSISSGKHHPLYFDYYNFPAESYKYTYDAPGDPELASRMHEQFKKAGIDSKLDDQRGWDHGVFVPMKLINPAANIPIVQISVLSNQNPERHYKIGQVLKQLRKEGVAILGSGMSYHNMYEFMNSRHKGKVVNEEFDEFLNKVCSYEEQTRYEALKSWREQPGASEAHPPRAAEHFMPLVVVAGAGGAAGGRRIMNFDYCGSFKLSSFIWTEE